MKPKMGDSRIVPALELKGVTRRWGERPPVFSKLDLAVPGEGITVLLGPSGCGKSTLLRCAASLDTADEGTILVGGIAVHEPSMSRQLILQDDSQLFPWLTVEQNVAYPIKTRKAASKDHSYEGRARDLLALVELSEAADHYPSELSGGMKQRAVLARALNPEPEILLLDEPFAALDAVIRARLQELLRRLSREADTAMLLVTHDVTEALVLADSLAFMDSSGRLTPLEANPLGDSRDTESHDFFRAMGSLRRRYTSLFNPIDL